jgi:hypothetical protein
MQEIAVEGSVSRTDRPEGPNHDVGDDMTIIILMIIMNINMMD